MEGNEDFFVDVCADDGGKNICTLAKAQNGKESRWIGHRMFLDEAGERARRLGLRRCVVQAISNSDVVQHSFSSSTRPPTINQQWTIATVS